MNGIDLSNKNLYASLENDSLITDVENSTPQWDQTHWGETNLAPVVAYDNGPERPKSEITSEVAQPVVTGNNAKIVKAQSQITQPQVLQPQVVQSAQPTQVVQSAQPIQVVQSAQPTQVTQKYKPKRSVWGFIKFSLIVILIALIIYFTLYRIGWGITECSKRNYHDCAALLTPELSTLALTSIVL